VHVPICYSSKFIEVKKVCILCFLISAMTYMIISPNYRQILQVLGFFNEPQQAPMSFLPAALQTADATSSLPGAL
jgi:hypothetical protein